MTAFNKYLNACHSFEAISVHHIATCDICKATTKQYLKHLQKLHRCLSQQKQQMYISETCGVLYGGIFNSDEQAAFSCSPCYLFKPVSPL